MGRWPMRGLTSWFYLWYLNLHLNLNMNFPAGNDAEYSRGFTFKCMLK